MPCKVFNIRIPRFFSLLNYLLFQGFSSDIPSQTTENNNKRKTSGNAAMDRPPRTLFPFGNKFNTCIGTSKLTNADEHLSETIVASKKNLSHTVRHASKGRASKKRGTILLNGQLVLTQPMDSWSNDVCDGKTPSCDVSTPEAPSSCGRVANVEEETIIS
jgi:hypothetical protein